MMILELFNGIKVLANADTKSYLSLWDAGIEVSEELCICLSSFWSITVLILEMRKGCNQNCE